MGDEDATAAWQVEAVRRFNRFYTRRIGVLREGLLDSDFSLTQARVLYELANRDGPTASVLATDLGLDPGYLSRVLRGFDRRGLLTRRRAAHDARHAILGLTAAGRRAFTTLDRRSRREIGDLLAAVDADDRARLVGAMQAVEAILGERPPGNETFVLRPHRPGDLGWIVMRHAVRYAADFGWDGRFEAMVADVAAQFVRSFDPDRERCWIAERDGERIGSVMVVNAGDGVAKLRLLLVEPAARGLGLGTRLVEECLRFARGCGYRRMVLWTNDVLVEARRIYERAGFTRVASEPHESFGQHLVGETWERDLFAASLPPGAGAAG